MNGLLFRISFFTFFLLISCSNEDTELPPQEQPHGESIVYCIKITGDMIGCHDVINSIREPDQRIVVSRFSGPTDDQNTQMVIDLSALNDCFKGLTLAGNTLIWANGNFLFEFVTIHGGYTLLGSGRFDLGNIFPPKEIGKPVALNLTTIYLTHDASADNNCIQIDKSISAKVEITRIKERTDCDC